MTRKTHVQRHLGRQPETGIQQQPCLVPVGHADPPALRNGKTPGAADVDKWALYAIAQYCDQTVPDGFGAQSRG